jgi:hypothetical protein
MCSRKSEGRNSIFVRHTCKAVLSPLKYGNDVKGVWTEMLSSKKRKIMIITTKLIMAVKVSSEKGDLVSFGQWIFWYKRSTFMCTATSG